MARRLWTAAVLSSLAFSSSGLAQSAAEGNVVTLRTAGQPERKLQVLRSERLPDGKILTEVKDLSTGAIFTIADTKPLGTPEKAASLPVSTPAGTGMLPGTSVPAGSLPQARPRNADPLLAGTAVNPQPVQQVQPQQTQQQFPTLMGKLRGNKSEQPAPAATAPTTGVKQQSGISAALFGSNTAAPKPSATLINRTPAAAAASATPQSASNMPTLAGKLFGDKPAPQAPVNTAKTTSFIRPNAVPTAAPVNVVSAAPAPSYQPQPVATASYAPSAAPAMQPVQPAALTPVSSDARDPNFHVVPVKPMTMKQIEDMVKDLRMHARPSVRIEAAMALASCPMSGMVEVRQILAEASYRDPEPVVRARCIDLLTQMQYDEPNYKKYVETLVTSEEPSLQRAARAAAMR